MFRRDTEVRLALESQRQSCTRKHGIHAITDTLTDTDVGLNIGREINEQAGIDKIRCAVVTRIVAEETEPLDETTNSLRCLE